MNERKTENIVRQHFSKNGNLVLEEQRSDNPLIQSLLRGASKTGGGGIAQPEFIFQPLPSVVCVVECKADPEKHQSETGDRFAEYAVDGVKLYAAALAKRYDVIAIAVSGEINPNISTFLHRKGKELAEDLEINTLRSPDEYIAAVRDDPEIKERAHAELLSSASELHNYLRDYAKLSEAEKPLLVAGILIALTDPAFEGSYDKTKHDQTLAKSLHATIRQVLIDSDLPEQKVNTMMQPFSFMTAHPVLADKESKDRPLLGAISRIDEKVKPFINHYDDVDVVGQFYGEFLSYTAGDKKGLGIVLTPKHICELMVELVKVNQDTVLLDTCCGTGGFLIAGMSRMLQLAGNNPEKIQKIKSSQIVGVEQQPQMFDLAASNLLLRGDGKSNLYLASAFSLTKELEEHKPTACCINPPYSQKGEGLGELDFVLHALDRLTPGSLLAAIIPMSCAISDKKKKTAILEKHTLESVMTMPPTLFQYVGTMTCIMIFRAKVPHDPETPSWFARWEDDGFEVQKKKGRVDTGQWKEIRNRWLSDYKRRPETPGYSVALGVTAEDEWLAQAYIETNYDTLSAEDFEEFLITSQIMRSTIQETAQCATISILNLMRD